MADFVGGSEANSFTGTAGDDSFTPGTGGGYVRGEGGVDTLILNYSTFASNPNAYGSLFYSYYTNGTPSGSYNVGGVAVPERTDIYDIDVLHFVGGSYSDDVNIEYFGTLNIGLNLDGGIGASNSLRLNYRYEEAATFIYAGGSITSNMGTFARFQNFELHTGNGNDTIELPTGAMIIETRAGDDRIIIGTGGYQIFAGEGADHIEAGSDDNQIMANGYYPTNAWFDSDADYVDAGAGNDTIYVGANDTVIGGLGIDTLWLDMHGSTVGLTIDMSVLLSGGTIQNGTGTISGIEKIGNILLGDGDDTVTLGNLTNDPWGNSVLVGNGGNDTLIGGTANNVFWGGAGNDHLVGLGGADDLSGNGGDDWLEGGDGNDRLFGEDGNDAIDGGLGDDQLDGWSGNDTITGGDGNDAIQAGSGDDQVDGGLGADRISGGTGVDLLNGGDGNDWISSGDEYSFNDQPSVDTVNGGAGDDRLLVGLGDNADGGTGYDVLSLNYAGAASGITVNLADVLAGVAGANVGGTASGIEALNSVIGSANADVITIGNVVLVADEAGAAGFVSAGAGNDTVTGGTGNDLLNGDSGDDSLFGLGGNDTFDATQGNDLLYGGTGDDTYDVDDMADVTFENAGEGTDTVRTFGGVYLYANVENLTLLGGGGVFGVGNELDNVLTGNVGDNLLIGGAGNDTLSGDQGNDLLYGQDGADTINGGYGIDYLVGGAGNDVMNGGALADALYGEDGDDILIGDYESFDTDILVGGAGNDTLYGNSGFSDYDLMDGGSGNDTYWVDTGDDLTFEAAGGGIDTVHANIGTPNGGVYLYANVENLVLEGTTAFGVGNELDNLMTGSASANWLLGGLGADTLNGLAGNDVLFGEGGADTFVFQAGCGKDLVGDFVHGTDKIQLNGIYTSFSQLQSHFVQNGANGAIDLGGGSIVVLRGVTMSTLNAADFIFAPAGEPAPKGLAVMEAPAWQDEPLLADPAALGHGYWAEPWIV